MAEQEGSEERKPVAMTTSNQLRLAAEQAGLRGDWDVMELLNTAADRLLALEAQNIAYRHALTREITININGKRRWFHIGRD